MGRDLERIQRGERSGGLGDSKSHHPEWIHSIHTLFPQRVIERAGKRCRTAATALKMVVTNLDVLERIHAAF